MEPSQGARLLQKDGLGDIGSLAHGKGQIMSKPKQPPPFHGVAARSVKLTPLQVRFIRDAFATHMKERRAAGFKTARSGLIIHLSKIFGIAVRTVQSVTRDERWDHLRW